MVHRTGVGVPRMLQRSGLGHSTLYVSKVRRSRDIGPCFSGSALQLLPVRLGHLVVPLLRLPVIDHSLMRTTSGFSFPLFSVQSEAVRSVSMLITHGCAHVYTHPLGLPLLDVVAFRTI